MAYQGDIRDSQINELFERVENRNYNKYLKRVTQAGGFFYEGTG